MKHVFLGVVLFIVGIVGWSIIKLGFFKNVEITQQEFGDIQCVYLEHIGPYHKILDSLEKVEDWAQKNNIDCSKSFGHFLDDPDIVEHERLKSHVGCVVASNPGHLPTDFKFKIIPNSKYFVADFLGSPAIGPMKVYKKAQQEFYDRKLTPPQDIIEIYQRLGEKTMKTSYLFRIQ